jgi:hypothetical protein
MSDAIQATASRIHEAQEEYRETLVSAALASGMEEIHKLRDTAREALGPLHAHMVKDLRNAATRDENGEEYIEMSSKQRVDLARDAWDIQAEIHELTEKLERILSKLIHGDME